MLTVVLDVLCCLGHFDSILYLAVFFFNQDGRVRHLQCVVLFSMKAWPVKHKRNTAQSHAQKKGLDKP